MLELPASRPAQSYDEALARARTMMELDDARIAHGARTRVLDHGRRMPYAVVLLHGLTNHPGQFVEFAPQLFQAGVNVVVPRLPEHGDSDRMTKRLEYLTAEMLVQTTTEALDIACGLGERVAVLGISLGGVLAAYAGQHRADVDTAVPVSPMFALLQLPYGVSKALIAVLRMLPNMFLWWDPRLKEKQRPHTAYPRFSTHALAQTMRIGDDVHACVERDRAKARRIVCVTNRCDPAVNNQVTNDIVQRWRESHGEGIEDRELRNLPENHDIIDPDNALARTDIVYPALLEALALQ